MFLIGFINIMLILSSSVFFYVPMVAR